MARFSDLRVVQVYWAFRYAEGHRVQIRYNPAPSHLPSEELTGTVTRCYMMGAYAGDRYLRFPVVEVYFHDIGLRTFEEYELTPAAVGVTAGSC